MIWRSHREKMQEELAERAKTEVFQQSSSMHMKKYGYLAK
jgi:hypothetical protein